MQRHDRLFPPFLGVVFAVRDFEVKGHLLPDTADLPIAYGESGEVGGGQRWVRQAQCSPAMTQTCCMCNIHLGLSVVPRET